MSIRPLLLMSLGVASACAATRAVAPRPAPPLAPPPTKTIALEPMRIDVVQGEHGPTATAYDARSLLDDGNEALVMRRYDDALAAYDHLLADFPDSRLAPSALWGSGQAYEGKEDWGRAAARYRQLLDRSVDSPETHVQHKDAQLRLGAVLAEAGEYVDSSRVLQGVLELTDLTPDERIEALARLGFALAETKDYVGAEDVLRRALAYHREIQGTTPLESRTFVAMAQFYLAEIPHQQFLAIPLRYPEEQMRRDVEQKSQLFLLARDRYVKTVEIKDPTWATAAVYEMADMYKQFWDQWMAVPIPANFSPAEAKEYTKQVNEEPQLRKLLEKSLYFHEKNVAMAREAKISTGWSERSSAEAESIRKILAQQERGETIRPGSAVEPASGFPSPPHSGGSRRLDVYIPARVDL